MSTATCCALTPSGPIPLPVMSSSSAFLKTVSKARQNYQRVTNRQKRCNLLAVQCSKHLLAKLLTSNLGLMTCEVKQQFTYLQVYLASRLRQGLCSSGAKSMEANVHHTTLSGIAVRHCSQALQGTCRVHSARPVHYKKTLENTTQQQATLNTIGSSRVQISNTSNPFLFMNLAQRN